MHRTPQRSAVTAFAAEPTSATAARRFVRQTLHSAGITQGICDRAELIVSELVTNAVLHAGTGPVVSVRIEDENVRIAVEDTSPVAPVLREYGLDASTGRGLRVVSTAASEWGVETTSSGKAVWATLFTATTPSSTMSSPLLSYREDTKKSSPNALDHIADEPKQLVTYKNIPVQLYLRLEAHNESLVREFSLLAIQASADENRNMPQRLREAVALSTKIDVRFTMLRIGARAAVREEHEQFSMDLHLPESVAQQLQQFDQWATMTDELSDEKLLLTAAAPAPVQALRSWLIAQTLAQLDGQPAASWDTARSS